VLYSRERAQELIESCKKAQISQIYLQVFQSGKAYYDSKIAGREKYENMLKSAGADMVDYLLEEAGKSGIAVFAWVNVLSLGKNDRADVLEKFGTGVLTRDQNLRTPLRSDGPSELDKYYLREDQLFLDPADPRVKDYVRSVIAEIISRYPGLQGVHLDYIRYPYIVPTVPGSRFNRCGLTYGYTKSNIEEYTRKAGVNPHSGKMNDSMSIAWDNWKREQLTGLVSEISQGVKKAAPGMLVSCAVLPSLERAYTSSCQDWPLWLEQGIVDYVAVMDYGLDSRFVYETAKAALSLRGRGKVYIGIGAFVLKDDPDNFCRQYRMVSSLDPDGIMLFSFDDITAPILECLKPQ
jgi:uncharacterized lipoprotein YddW (UPF0748 family)